MGARYSVYRRKDDSPVIIHGTRIQCAKAMGISESSFDEYASRQRHGVLHCTPRRKWDIIREEEDG
jgi:hypothetical protein